MDEIVPLSILQGQVDVVKALLPSTKAGTDAHIQLRALVVALELLRALWQLKHSRWDRVKQNVSVGLIKGSEKYGNTSVSMGAMLEVPPCESASSAAASASAATSSAAAASTALPPFVAFLNCGTGNIKYQLYANEEKCVRLVEEKISTAASPNYLSIGSYTPHAPMDFDKTKQHVEQELKTIAPWRNHARAPPVYAFVTGTIRQHWEDANTQQKTVYEQAITNLFRDTNVKPFSKTGSFFITQEEEGKLELYGAKRFYENMRVDGVIDGGMHVVGTFGIGKGSSQWVVLKRCGQTELIGHRAGMNDLEGLSGAPHTVLEAYRDEDKFGRFLDALESVPHPVIALKSGCVLAFDNAELSDLRALVTGGKKQRTVAGAHEKAHLSSIL